jgi:hypothetical protein
LKIDCRLKQERKTYIFRLPSIQPTSIKNGDERRSEIMTTDQSPGEDLFYNIIPDFLFILNLKVKRIWLLPSRPHAIITIILTLY